MMDHHPNSEKEAAESVNPGDQRLENHRKYEKEFSHLSKYAPKSVLTEVFRCRKFEDGLNESIKGYLAPVTSLQ